MKTWETVAIVGVGLIGGSIGLSLRRRNLAKRVVGIGRRQKSLDCALQRQAVTTATTDLSEGVKDAQIVIVCTPVDLIVDHAIQASHSCPHDAIITDAGSTKCRIVEQATAAMSAGVNFVGSHPMAGSEKHGPDSADSELFRDRVTVVTPVAETPQNVTDNVSQFWKSLGANVISMSPQQHDQAVAATSHVPHLVASALAAATAKEHLPVAATGWLDTTRVAAGNAELWEQILTDNQAQVLKSLDKFETVLGSLREALHHNHSEDLIQLLEVGKQTRDAVGS